MNLALHGFLLQVLMSILNFQHGRLLCSAGEPGYLDFDNLPETNFSCQGKVIGGYYADVEAGCQMFHVCTIGQKDEIMDIKFLCLNGTVFDQETRVCERVDEVDCSKSERFYNLNLELYGNNAVTLSLHESNDDEDDLSDLVEEHQQRTTSTRPSTTSTTSTTTSRPSKPSTTAASGSFQHPTGYPQHYQPQPLFPQVHASQSKSLYDDKNGGYHHQYIFHNGERINNNQATSYQLFSNQGVSSTTVTPPQIHQIRFSSTVGPQIIHNEPSTVTPLFHATSSTIQTLLNSNANSPALINPIYHNHGITSTTEQFTVHSNNPRETSDYRDNADHEQNIRPLEAIQPANKGKISKLTISPIPIQHESSRIIKTKTSQTSQQQRISGNFLPTPAPIESTVRSFYPTPRPSPKPLLSHSVTHQVTQHINIPPVTIPQLKPLPITINLSPPDIQRIVQNPSPLLPSQSRVIVTAKASVSDESGRPLNTTQLVTLPLPAIPASYDDYKEGDESFDPFYRDVPKILKNHRIVKSMVQNIKFSRKKRSPDQTINPMHHIIYGVDDGQREDTKVIQQTESYQNNDNITNESDADITTNIEDFRSIKESLIRFRDILFGDEVDEESFRSLADEIKHGIEDTRESETSNTKSIRQEEAIKILDYLEDLNTEASKHFSLNKEDENEEIRNKKVISEDLLLNINETDKKIMTKEKKNIEDTTTLKSESEIEIESTTINYEQNEPQEHTYVIIVDSYNDSTIKSISINSDDLIETTTSTTTTTNTPIEIIIQQETKSASHEISRTNEKVICNGKIAEYVAQDKLTEIPRSSMTIDNGKQSEIPEELSNRKNPIVSTEQKSGTRRKNSRRRSSKRRISSRIKQQKMNNVKVTETVHQRENDTTAITVTAATITSTPSIALLETEVSKRIDSHTFEEPISQMSREINTNIDTRHSTTYSNNLRGNRDHSISKNEELEESFDHQNKQDYNNNFENVDKSEEQPSTTPEYSSFTENPQNSEETESVDVTYPSEEEKSSESSSKEYEALDYASVASTDDEEIETNSEQVHNKVASLHETTISHENKLSYHKDKNSKVRNNDSEEDRHLTAKSSEETNLEEFNEYNTTQLSVESTDITSNEEDYKSYSESTEDFTTSMDYTGSEEYTDSQADTADSAEEAVSTTDGVLKFTDELPKLDNNEDIEATIEVIGSHESSEHDYVDDNYEPENYKELKPINKWNDSKEKKSEKNDEKNKNKTEDPNYIKNIEEHQKNDSIKEETQTESIRHITEITDLNEEVFTTLTTTFPTTSTISTTTPTTTSSTTTSTTTTTTTVRPTITVPHVTAAKPFKSISRKNYAYIPPMSSPNPVVIKPRQGLNNPKPAKPPKSYNELVPKPVIRKISLVSRKPITTATTTIDKLYIESTTEPVIITTESRRSEENILENKLEAKNHKTVSSNSFRELDTINKEDQLSSPSVQDFPSNTSKDVNPHGSNKKIETFTPYPLSRLPVTSSIKETTKKTEAKPQKISDSIGIVTTTLFPEKSEYVETHTVKYDKEMGMSSSSKIYQDITETLLNLPKESTSILPPTTIRNNIEDTTSTMIELTSFRPINRRPTKPRRHMSFNCLEKEMYRFYGDVRDCRLFHYCSPGFTSRQVLDFRFVCEEGTAFDEMTQSCRHEVRNRKCRNRAW